MPQWTVSDEAGFTSKNQGDYKWGVDEFRLPSRKNFLFRGNQSTQHACCGTILHVFWLYPHVARTETHTHYAYDERRGKAAMDEIGILPQFTGTLVRDGFPSYRWYEQCDHSHCNVHMLRELLYIEEVDSDQKVWIEPLRKLLFTAKEVASEAKESGNDQIDAQKQNSFFRRYGQILRQADELNPQPPKRTSGPGPPVKRRESGPTARSIINRLQKKRDEILRFMTDLTVPFDNNGSERDLRMLKLVQKISGCFRTADGARSFCRVRSYLSTARKQGHSLLCSIETVMNGKPLPVSC
jgi:transposase